MDETGKATLREAMAAQFDSYEGTLTKGYTASAAWLKLRIPGRASPEPLALIVRPAYLRTIEIHDPALVLQPGAIVPLVSGRDALLGRNNHVGLNNGFIIPASTAPRDVFLRIATTTALNPDVDLLPFETAEHGSILIAGLISVYIAFILAFCLWALVKLIVRREMIYGRFLLRQLYSMMHLFVFSGLMRHVFSDTLSAQTRDFIYNFITITVIAAAGQFDLKLLSEFGAARWLQNILRAILTLPLISLVLLLLGHTLTALQVNAMIVNLAVVVLLFLALSTQDDGRKPYGRGAVLILRLGYLLITLSVFVPTLMWQNVISTSLPVINMLFMHTFISTVILTAVLSIRAHQNDLQAQQALLHYQIKARELEAENKRRMEKERFLSMLTHELRNPLALIRLVMTPDSPNGRTVVKAATEMAKVIERVEQSEKLDDKQIEIETSPFDLRVCLDDLVHGSEAADRIELVAPAALTVTTDETLLRSIVKNLLDNADKYSPPASPIRVTAMTDRMDGMNGVRIEVANDVGDAGKPDAEKLFTKYYRSKGAHRRPGSGLGLFLVSNWARMLRGELTYAACEHPDKTQSVSFNLWIPLWHGHSRSS